VITRLQWYIWESYALSCVYGYVLWDSQHAHTIAHKLHSSHICIKSCIYSIIMIWIFLYRYQDSEFYIDISVSRTSLFSTRGGWKCFNCCVMLFITFFCCIFHIILIRKDHDNCLSFFPPLLHWHQPSNFGIGSNLIHTTSPA